MTKEELKEILKEHLKVNIAFKECYYTFLGPKHLKAEIQILFDDEVISISDATKLLK